MRNGVWLNKDALDELCEWTKERDVLYVFPGMGENVKTLSIGARSVWTVGTVLEPANPDDPTPAAELVHNLEASMLADNTTALLGHTETLMAAIIAVRFDMVIIDWCDAQQFTPGLLWKACALAPRVAIVGHRAGPRAQLTEMLFRGTGWHYCVAGSTAVFTAPNVETVPEAELY